MPQNMSKMHKNAMQVPILIDLTSLQLGNIGLIGNRMFYARRKTEKSEKKETKMCNLITVNKLVILYLIY